MACGGRTSHTGAAPSPGRLRASRRLLLAAVLCLGAGCRSTPEPAAAAESANPGPFVEGLFVGDLIPASRLALHRDGTFDLNEPGAAVSGTYTLDGDRLTLHADGEARSAQFTGDAIIDPHGSRWSRQQDRPAANGR